MCPFQHVLTFYTTTTQVRSWWISKSWHQLHRMRNQLHISCCVRSLWILFHCHPPCSLLLPLSWIDIRTQDHKVVQPRANWNSIMTHRAHWWWSCHWILQSFLDPWPSLLNCHQMWSSLGCQHLHQVMWTSGDLWSYIECNHYQLPNVIHRSCSSPTHKRSSLRFRDPHLLRTLDLLY